MSIASARLIKCEMCGDIMGYTNPTEVRIMQPDYEHGLYGYRVNVGITKLSRAGICSSDGKKVLCNKCSPFSVFTSYISDSSKYFDTLKEAEEYASTFK